MTFARMCINEGCGHSEAWHKSADKPVPCFHPVAGQKYCGCEEPKYA
jgi:hypothetical protein